MVFRKMGPTRFQPSHLYVYINSPTSAIAGRLPITQLDILPIDDAIKIADAGMLTEEELRAYATPAYAKPYSALVVYRVGRFQPAASPITKQLLASNFGFWPSPSFIPLSKAGKNTLDRLGKFDE